MYENLAIARCRQIKYESGMFLVLLDEVLGMQFPDCPGDIFVRKFSDVGGEEEFAHKALDVKTFAGRVGWYEDDGIIFCGSVVFGGEHDVCGTQFIRTKVDWNGFASFGFLG